MALSLLGRLTKPVGGVLLRCVPHHNRSNKGFKMGFRKEPTLYKLKFEDPQYNGLEVIAKSLPLGDFLEFNKMSAEVTVENANSPEMVKKSGMMFTLFAANLVSWNLEDENGKPVPSTYKGVVSQEMGFILDIIKAWMDAVADVPKHSKNGSNSGGTSRVPSLPMATL